MNARNRRIATPLLAAPLLLVSLLLASGCEEESTNRATTTTTETPNSTKTKVSVKKYDSLNDLMKEVAKQYEFLKLNVAEGDQTELLECTDILIELFRQAGLVIPKYIDHITDDEKWFETAGVYSDFTDATSKELEVLRKALEQDDRTAASESVERLRQIDEFDYETFGIDRG
ncbi:MAG: hypothetical protein AAGD32_11235 [Planctomycetota bacterium]